MTTRTSWYDLNKDGQRLNRIIKQMETKMNTMDTDDPDQIAIYLAYCDRLIRATSTKVNIAETVLGIKNILAEANKSLPKPQGYLYASK